MNTINEPKKRKPWAKPVFFTIDHNPIQTGNHNGFKESTVHNTTSTFGTGYRTFYFRTQNNAKHALFQNNHFTPPNQYFS
jgi:hypothetical protein